MVLFLNEIQQEESVILFRTLLAKLQGIFMDIESSNKKWGLYFTFTSQIQLIFDWHLRRILIPVRF